MERASAATWRGFRAQFGGHRRATRRWRGLAVVALNSLLRILPLMASPNGIATLPRIRPGRRGALAQLLELQRIVFEAAAATGITATGLAALVRAWCGLQETKRVLRGKPLPGALRPDLDNQQLARAIKRARVRGIIDAVPAQLAGSTGPIEVPPDEVAQTEAEAETAPENCKP